MIAKDDYYYVICDSSWSIYRVRKVPPTFLSQRNACRCICIRMTRSMKTSLCRSP